MQIDLHRVQGVSWERKIRRQRSFSSPFPRASPPPRAARDPGRVRPPRGLGIPPPTRRRLAAPIPHLQQVIRDPIGRI
jgi:hypothetical protein